MPTTQTDKRQVKRVLELAMQAGEILLQSGAEISRVEETINIMVRAFGLEFSYNIVTPTGLQISIDNGYDADETNEGNNIYPLTLVKRVRSRALNYYRISQVNDLSRRVVQGMVTLEQALRELDRINHAPSPYPFWLRLLAGTGTAASVTLLLGGAPLDVLPVLVSTVLALSFNRFLTRTRIPLFFGDFFGATLATSITLLLVWLGLPVHSNFVIAGGIILLVPGAALVASVQDGISGDLLSSAARGLETLLKGASIAGGVGLGLSIALGLDISLQLNQRYDVALWQMPVQVAAAGLAAAGFAIYNFIPRFAILTSGLAGGAVWLTHMLAERFFNDSGGLFPTFLAAFLAGLLAWQLARWQHAPNTIYILPGILPLLPGLTIYDGMLSLSQNHNLEGLLLLTHAVFLGGALAAGVALSNSLTLTLQHGRKRQN